MKLEKIKEANDIKTAVGKSFIRVMKNHNLYGVFISSFNKMQRDTRNRSNPFGYFDSFETLMNRIDKFTNEHLDEELHSRLMSSGNKDYDKITSMINHMLHFFLENNGVDVRKLGMFGQEIFDMSCYSLFGDNYVKQMDKVNKDAPRPTNDLEAYLVSQYMSLMQRGEANIPWKDFYEKSMKYINKDMFNEENYANNPVTRGDDGGLYYDFDDEEENNNYDEEDDYFDDIFEEDDDERNLPF